MDACTLYGNALQYFNTLPVKKCSSLEPITKWHSTCGWTGLSGYGLCAFSVYCYCQLFLIRPDGPVAGLVVAVYVELVVHYLIRLALRFYLVIKYSKLTINVQNFFTFSALNIKALRLTQTTENRPDTKGHALSILHKARTYRVVPIYLRIRLVYIFAISHWQPMLMWVKKGKLYKPSQSVVVVLVTLLYGGEG